jgi:hypothetical protein
MAGVNPGAVQRILRHSDPRITTKTYGHPQPDSLRSEIDRLRFGSAPAADLSSASLPKAGLSPKASYNPLTRTADPTSRRCRGRRISRGVLGGYVGGMDGT